MGKNDDGARKLLRLSVDKFFSEKRLLKVQGIRPTLISKVRQFVYWRIDGNGCGCTMRRFLKEWSVYELTRTPSIGKLTRDIIRLTIEDAGLVLRER